MSANPHNKIASLQPFLSELLEDRGLKKTAAVDCVLKELTGESTSVSEPSHIVSLLKKNKKRNNIETGITRGWESSWNPLFELCLRKGLQMSPVLGDVWPSRSRARTGAESEEAQLASRPRQQLRGR